MLQPVDAAAGSLLPETPPCNIRQPHTSGGPAVIVAHAGLALALFAVSPRSTLQGQAAAAPGDTAGCPMAK
jgi:hypothetical protein